MDDIQEQLLNKVTTLDPVLDCVRTVTGSVPDSTLIQKSDFIDSLFADAVSFSIVANANDVTFTGMSTSHMVRMSNNGSYNITGLQTGRPGRILILHNIGAGTLTLVDESDLSQAYNRFALTANIAMAPDTMVILQYDGSTQRWRAAGGGGGAGGHTIQDEGISLPTRAKLNFTGAAVTATDNPGADATDIALLIIESALSFSDNATNDVTTAKHGLMSKLPGHDSKAFMGDGTWSSVPRVDGWIRFNDVPCTYVSGYSFTVSGNYSMMFRKGARVVWNDSGGWKYGIILSSSYSAPNTTVTLFTNSDYVMAAGITDMFLSYEPLPNGFPTAFNYTPGVANVTLGNGTITGKFFVLGSQVFGGILLTRGTTTSFGSDVTLGTPSVTNESNYFVVGNVSIVDYQTALYTGIMLSGGSVRCMNAAGTYAVYAYVTNAVPFAWGASDFIDVSFRYRY